MTAPQKKPQIKLPPKAEALARIREQREAAFSAVIGQKMPDGTIFAGALPNGKKVFAMPNDAGIAMDFNTAAAYAAKLNNNKKLGHDDWRIPSKEELDLLYRNRNKGALKDTLGRGWYDDVTDGDYWSSTPASIGISTRYMHVQRLSDGAGGQSDVKCRAAVRCVR